MQEVIKNLLIFLKDNGLADYIYTAFHLLSFVVAVPCFLVLGKKMKVRPVKGFLALLMTCVMFLALMYFIGWLEAVLGLGNFGRKNAVTVYIWIPFICAFSAKTFKINTLTMENMMAFAMPFIQAVSRPGCLAAGCCKGFPWKYGIYQPWVQEYLFPMPIFEMLWMFGIAFLILWLIKKNNYKATEHLYPLLLVVYGTVQFFSEFFIDNAKIWHNFSLRSFHEISIVIVGTVWLCLLQKRKKSILYIKRDVK